ncbi:hypothetical protein ACFVZR_07565 [Streptomyces sp. NPDC058316]|uniref:hypothetical protein n=1 Tax=Streptomyces sp. NPDC058316 TaxID=3346442 RepID=UPI0036E0CE82
MSDRIPLDDLTSDALDALYDDRDRAQRSATYRLDMLRKRRQQIRDAEQRAEQAEAAIERVRTELDRIADLDTVRHDDGRADRFSTGARWTLRMIRENAIAEQQPTT